MNLFFVGACKTAMPPKKRKSRAPSKRVRAKPKSAKGGGSKRKSAKPRARASGPSKGAARGPTPYIKFCKIARPQIVKANPGISFGEIGRKLGEAWGKLSAAEKAKWATK